MKNDNQTLKRTMTSRHIMMIIWLIIGFAHLKSRKQQTETPAYYVKWFVHDMVCDCGITRHSDHHDNINCHYRHYCGDLPFDYSCIFGQRTQASVNKKPSCRIRQEGFLLLCSFLVYTNRRSFLRF